MNLNDEDKIMLQQLRALTGLSAPSAVRLAIRESVASRLPKPKPAAPATKLTTWERKEADLAQQKRDQEARERVEKEARRERNRAAAKERMRVGGPIWCRQLGSRMQNPPSYYEVRDLGWLVEDAIEHRAFEHWLDADGKSFPDIESFWTAPKPYGLGRPHSELVEAIEAVKAKRAEWQGAAVQ